MSHSLRVLFLSRLNLSPLRKVFTSHLPELNVGLVFRRNVRNRQAVHPQRWPFHYQASGDHDFPVHVFRDVTRWKMLQSDSPQLVKRHRNQAPSVRGEVGADR